MAELTEQLNALKVEKVRVHGSWRGLSPESQSRLYCHLCRARIQRSGISQGPWTDVLWILLSAQPADG